MSGEEKLVKCVKLLCLQRLTKFVVLFFCYPSLYFYLHLLLWHYTEILACGSYRPANARLDHTSSPPLELWWCSPVVVIV